MSLAAYCYLSHCVSDGIVSSVDLCHLLPFVICHIVSSVALCHLLFCVICHIVSVMTLCHVKGQISDISVLAIPAVIVYSKTVSCWSMN